MGLLLIVRLWASLSSLCERIPSGNAPGATQDTVLPDRPRHAPDPVIRLLPYHFCIFHQAEVNHIYTKILRMHDQSEFQGLQCPTFAPGALDPRQLSGSGRDALDGRCSGSRGTFPASAEPHGPKITSGRSGFGGATFAAKTASLARFGITEQIDLSGD